tara:strand:+ start:111 stop:863 length:753 start_codon:yes stop_codon:yes gene_type:complete
MKFDTEKYLKLLKTKNLGKNILYLNETSSTNDEVWNHIKKNNHIVVVAENQKKGRGRRNNSWLSLSEKSLTFSLGIQLNKSNSNLIPLISSIAIYNAIYEICKINIGIKWPNDILCNEKKIAGILIESKLKEMKKTFNIGIGINVNWNKNDIVSSNIPNITSISLEANKNIIREIILSNFMLQIENLLLISNEEIIQQWIARCMHINKKVTFHYNDEIIHGLFKGIDTNGFAKIENENNKHIFPSGVIEV